MKLYSRKQLIFFSLMSALIVILFSLGIGLLKFPKSQKPLDTNITLETASENYAQASSRNSGKLPKTMRRLRAAIQEMKILFLTRYMKQA